MRDKGRQNREREIADRLAEQREREGGGGRETQRDSRQTDRQAYREYERERQ